MKLRHLSISLLVSAAACSTQSQGASTSAVEESLSYFERSPSAVGLADVRAELTAKASRQDERGTTHVRFQQLYQGLAVFEGEAISHVDAQGNVTETSALRDVRGLDPKAKVSRQDAVRAALDKHSAAAAQSKVEASLEVLPKGERSSKNRLVWHLVVESETESGPAHWNYFVDAHDGSLVWSFDSLETSASIGTGKTMFAGDQPISTDFASGTYALRDLIRGSGNYTCDKNNKTNSPACTVFTRANNIFGNNVKDSSDRATAGADAHYGLQATWDYYQAMFGRNGIDGAGRQTYSRVHYGTNYQNAFWSDSCFCMTYGDGGTTFYPLVSLDVAGHEMSHGVMSTEANLTYSGESGGLNESNSDIFGTMVEYAVNSAQDVPDYLIGERIYKANWSGGTYVNNAALRYMADPARDGRSPACWSSTLGSLDVHYSSGPNNHMFYLLAEGGTSKCNGNVVTGIGRDKAARIWYKAITDYMTASTNYAGARGAALSAASALYGAGSAEVSAVAAAYSAINVN